MNVKSLWVINTNVLLDNTNNDSTSLLYISSEIESYITKTLNDNFLTFHSLADSSFVAETLSIQKLLENVETT